MLPKIQKFKTKLILNQNLPENFFYLGDFHGYFDLLYVGTSGKMGNIFGVFGYNH